MHYEDRSSFIIRRPTILSFKSSTMSTAMNEYDAIADKDALIEHLRGELTTLGRQVEEIQDLRMSMVKITGKNTVRKLKSTALTASDRVNGHCIGTYLRKVLWPDVKMMPSKWYKWSTNPRSICKRILSAVGVPRGVMEEDYWTSLAVTMTNDKLCAMRSNMKQALFDRFLGKNMKSSCKCSITNLILMFNIPVDTRGQEEWRWGIGGVQRWSGIAKRTRLGIEQYSTSELQ